MAIRYEVYHSISGTIYKTGFMTEAKARDYLVNEVLIGMQVGGHPKSDLLAVKVRQIEVPDSLFYHSNCKKEFYADYDTNNPLATVKCPYCGETYYARRLLRSYQPQQPKTSESISPCFNYEEKYSGYEKTKRDHDKIRMMEHRQWDMMSYSEKAQAREDMRFTGNYWGPEHEGFEYWL